MPDSGWPKLIGCYTLSDTSPSKVSRPSIARNIGAKGYDRLRAGRRLSGAGHRRWTAASTMIGINAGSMERFHEERYMPAARARYYSFPIPRNLQLSRCCSAFAADEIAAPRVVVKQLGAHQRQVWRHPKPAPGIFGVPWPSQDTPSSLGKRPDFPR